MISDACSFLSTGDAFGKHASGSKYGIAGGFRFGHGRFSVKQALVENGVVVCLLRVTIAHMRKLEQQIRSRIA